MELILGLTCEFNQTPSQGLAFDRLRGCLGLARSLWFILLVVPGVFLAGIGFLGGRQWRSRVAWAAVTLGIAAGIAYAAFGPVYHSVVEPRVDKALDEALAEATQDATGIELLMIQKSVVIGKTVIGDFAGGLEVRAWGFFFVAVVAAGLAILWPLLTGPLGLRRVEEPVQEDVPGDGEEGLEGVPGEDPRA